MNSAEFRAYKGRYRAAIEKALEETEPGRLDAIGFPAYAHANPLINWLFWKRLHTVINYVERSAPYERVLDFGCGSGVMLPFLARVSREVLATDIDLLPLETMKRHIPLAPSVHVRNLSENAISEIPPMSFDLIIALDVLEHVGDLAGTLTDLLRLLKRAGQLIISGPTENAVYQFGRKLAGPEYSGEYHKRGIADIRRELAPRASLKHIATLYWPVPLFEIFTAIA
jgi:2-polyprenyl-3-methyl-5-hydroxy-6-metoxy-1,4-benzoquinol methylase